MSSSKDKFLKLSNKISNLNVQLEKEKQLRAEHLETRYSNVQKRFVEFQNMQAQRYVLLRDQIVNLSKNIEDEKHSNHRVIDHKIK